jgi:hypothetical protein
LRRARSSATYYATLGTVDIEEEQKC